MSDAGYAVGRLILDPFSSLLYSTKAAEFSAVEVLVNQGVPVEEAIDQLLVKKALPIPTSQTRASKKDTLERKQG